MIILRNWQKDFVQSFIDWHENRQSGDSRTFTAAVCGGAGKTIGGCAIMQAMFHLNNFIVFAPDNTIAAQWENTFKKMNIPNAEAFTYAMMASQPYTIARKVTGSTFLIFDECHFLASSQKWGKIARTLGKKSAYRLMLTATAWREDEAQIPLVTYTDGQLQANFTYTYQQSLDDDFVRPIMIHALDGSGTFAHDEAVTYAKFTGTDENRLLNTVLEPSSDWMKRYIFEAHKQLRLINAQPDMPAQGIIACKDQDHARAVQRLVQQTTGSNPILAISDDADSDQKIADFREDKSAMWLIVVRKATQGMDNPRLRVGVIATNIKTQLFFNQFAYRIARKPLNTYAGPSHLFIPAHPAFIAHANELLDLRLHQVEESLYDKASRIFAEKAQPNSPIPISARPGTFDSFQIGNQTTALDKLIHIQEIAASSIADVAQGVDNVAKTLSKIRSLLHIPEPTKPEPPTNIGAILQNLQAEKDRAGWEKFKRLHKWLHDFDEKCYYAEALAILVKPYENGGGLVASDFINALPADIKSASYWGNNRSKNPLIKRKLITYEDGWYFLNLFHVIGEWVSFTPETSQEYWLNLLLSKELPDG